MTLFRVGSSHSAWNNRNLDQNTGFDRNRKVHHTPDELTLPSYLQLNPIRPQSLGTITGHNHWAQSLSTITGHNHWAQSLGTIIGRNHRAQSLGAITGRNHWAQSLGTIGYTCINHQCGAEFIAEVIGCGHLTFYITNLGIRKIDVEWFNCSDQCDLFVHNTYILSLD